MFPRVRKYAREFHMSAAPSATRHTSLTTEVGPLVVGPNRAMVILDCGRTRLYELIEAGEIDTYLDGASRKITVHSLCAYVQRKLEAAGSSSVRPKSRRPTNRRESERRIKGESAA
jgi:hypothetical protein